ncbi:MAG: hypothetical protein IKX84_00250, partial [Clostridia bacterium]|nr:hypothetical protein [Clostridia bacterium]
MKTSVKRALTVSACVLAALCACAYLVYALFFGADTLKVAARYRLLAADKEYVIDEKDAHIGEDGLLYVTGGEYESELSGRGFMYETLRYLPDAKATVLTAHFESEGRYVKLA